MDTLIERINAALEATPHTRSKAYLLAIIIKERQWREDVRYCEEILTRLGFSEEEGER